MVIPTALTVWLGGNVYWCWVFATAHIIGMSVCFWYRFRGGKWKSMRVIEPSVEGGGRKAEGGEESRAVKPGLSSS